MDEKTQATSLSALSMAGRSERRRPPLPKVAPWLLIPHGKLEKNQAFYNICEPDNRTCRKYVPELSGKSFYRKPCHQGWLVIRCSVEQVDYTPNWNYGDCFLWNPTTLETIQLPNILSTVYKFDKYILMDSVLTSPPRTASASTTNPGDGSDSLVFFLFRGRYETYKYVFLFCHPGDQHWRTQEVSRDIIDDEDPVGIISLNYLQGKLYGMSDNGNSHLQIEIQQLDDLNLKLVINPLETSCFVYFPYIGGMYTSDSDFNYVQTCDQELYRFALGYSTRSLMREVIFIRVVKLDFSLMEWKEVSSFGDHVLFFGKNTQASCSATELGLNGGCLYYTLPEDQSLYKYELEDHGFKAELGTITFPCLKLPTPWFSSGWIMIPLPTTPRVDDRLQIIEPKLHNIKEEDYTMDPRAKTSSSSQIKENHGEVYSSGELKQQRPLCILDKDALQMIASYLHPIDYKQFRQVCKENRSNLPIVKQTSTSKRIVSNTYVSPLLVYSTKSGYNIYNFVDPMHNNEKYFMKLPPLRGATIRFQKGGWLLMSEGPYRLFFHNPFTKETIELPDMPDSYGLTNISFSSLPTCYDCVVFGIKVSRIQRIGVYTLKRGEKSWKYQEFDNIRTCNYYMPSFNTPVLYKGILYCADYNGLLGAFSLTDGIISSFKVLEQPHETSNGAFPSFLVECGGDLLLVKLGHIGKFIGIFKLDFSKMEWVRVRSLGKHTLFISYTSCVSRMALCSDMENKIYFPRLSLHSDGILFYSLDTGSYNYMGSQHSSTDLSGGTKGWSSWSWVEPDWSSSTVQELDWYTKSSH